ncbi:MULTISPECIES: hypothetical protein [unclassified Legionella]|uniref:hypothetical protein n=1 Tax=unclassified Legionella TaxID=2622702 RepID=UPI0010552BE5|nr:MULTISPECIES: hypothetical protein [unclassified Legionella]MDI9818828.1 hypothetical protein [Legionella sp. PL877]
MKKRVLLIAITLLLDSNLIMAANNNTDREIKELVRFLISDKLLTPGKGSQLIPLSYYVGDSEDVARYFGDYICAADDTCSVIDSLYVSPYSFLASPYVILGRGLPPQQGSVQEWFQAQAQIERTNLKYGMDIYQASTWQIALALAARNDYLSLGTAQGLIANQLQSILNPANRATSTLFSYGYQQPVNNPRKAFVFRSIATDYYNKDPFFRGRYQNFISWDYDPYHLAQNDPENHPADFFKYVTTWPDWQPLTGENAWAQLIGPLQAEYLLTEGRITANSLPLINAINSLHAFSAMQTGIGAFYYAPGGTLGSQGLLPVGEISLEDNFSMLAGLQILKNILERVEQSPIVIEALNTIHIMLNGGMTVNGYETLGLLSFLYNGAFSTSKSVFYTRGIADMPSSQNDWDPDISDELSAMSVKVNLWGIAALGAETVDNWYGEGTALNIWRVVRRQGGYFENDHLWGVGYTLNNNANFQPEHVISTDNTASAINTLHMLIDYYSQREVDTTELEADLGSMQSNISRLRNDEYLNTPFFGATPKEFFVVLPPENGQAYLYSSRRLALASLWNANTLSATSSTSWLLINKFFFNPFQYQGKHSGEDYLTPASIDIFLNNNQPKGRALPRTLRVKFTAGNLGNIKKLILSYNLDGSQSSWVVAAVAERQQGVASLPGGARAILVSFYNGGWAEACQIEPAEKICKDAACMTTFTIRARWNSDGKGQCDLID